MNLKLATRITDDGKTLIKMNSLRVGYWISLDEQFAKVHFGLDQAVAVRGGLKGAANAPSKPDKTPVSYFSEGLHPLPAIPIDDSMQQEAIMFQVLDHSAVVYTGELSQTTQFVIDHYGGRLDEAIRSGIRIGYADPFRRLNEFAETTHDSTIPNFWKPIEDWELD